MGCVNCYQSIDKERLPAHLPPRRTGISQYVDAKGRKPLKIHKGNYVLIREGVLSDYYRVTEKIGEGAHGCIYGATHRRLNQPRAVKTIDRTKMPQKVQKQFLREVRALRDMDHPNILRIYEVIKEEKWYHIVTELLTGGELLDKIIGGEKCSEAHIAGYMQQLLSAVSYCHENGVIHRDLKLENLVFETTAPDALLKVIDFGASCWITEEQRGVTGTDFYLAPEILREEKHDAKCDVWSCGIIMYVLFCGYPPFNGVADCTIHRRILEQDLDFPPEEWKGVSRQAKSMIRQMLSKDPRHRPSAYALLSHPWMVAHTRTPSPLKNSLELSALTRLRDFRASSKLRQASLHLISTQIVKPEYFHGMRRMFLSLDKDKDGRLSKEELENGFTALSSSQKDAMRAVLSQSGDFIEFSEFLTATLSWSQVLDEPTIESAFETIDADGDGRVSAEQLREAIGGTEQSVDEETWQEVLREAEIDSDKGMDIVEFSKVISRKRLQVAH